VKYKDQTAPEITSETVLLSLDVESNGLHGKAFAVGAVLVRLDGTIVDEFQARSPIVGELDKFVKKYVLPPMEDFAQTHASAKAMRTAFWEWFVTAKDKCDYVLFSNGYPVESRFLATCQDDDIDARYWDHPFPIIDLSSLLIQVGIKPLAVRYQFVEDEMKGAPILQHHPRFDAWVAALAAAKAFRLSGRLKAE
jgi:hypothetical protein